MPGLSAGIRSGLEGGSDDEHLSCPDGDRAGPGMRTGKCVRLDPDELANVRIEYSDQADIEKDQIPDPEHA